MRVCVCVFCCDVLCDVVWSVIGIVFVCVGALFICLCDVSMVNGMMLSEFALCCNAFARLGLICVL